MTLLLFVATFFAVLLHLAVVTRRQGILTLDGLFVATQTVMCWGTLAIIDHYYAADRLYKWVVSIPLILYCLTSALVFYMMADAGRTKAPDKRWAVTRFEPTSGVVLLLVLSCIVTLSYYMSVGYNVFVIGIRGLLSGVPTEVTELRLGAYSGNKYFFPGYVNQFKNVVLPATSIVVCAYLFHIRSLARLPVTAVLACFVALGLLGTGQRGAFVVFVLMATVAIYHANPRKFPSRAALVSVAFLPVMVLTTLILGRGSSVGSGQLSRAWAALGQILERFIYVNQWAGRQGFRVTFERPTQFGSEWLQGILGVLPGNPGSSLASEIFATLYGSTRGTSPPSLWGSVHYNFGLVGLLLIPVLMAIAYQLGSLKMSQYDEVNSLQLIGMAGVAATGATWIAGGPVYLLNSGLVAYLLLWLLGARSSASDGNAARERIADTGRARAGVP